MVRIKIDDKLERKISFLQNHLKNNLGLKLSRPQVIEMLVRKYNWNKPLPKRKPRSKQWEF